MNNNFDFVKFLDLNSNISDWEIVSADKNRLKEFIQTYSKIEDVHDKRSLMEIIIYSLNDYLESDSYKFNDFSIYWIKIINILIKEAEIHKENLEYYWYYTEAEEIDGIIKLTPYIRCLAICLYKKFYVKNISLNLSYDFKVKDIFGLDLKNIDLNQLDNLIFVYYLIGNEEDKHLLIKMIFMALNDYLVNIENDNRNLIKFDYYWKETMGLIIKDKNLFKNLFLNSDFNNFISSLKLLKSFVLGAFFAIYQEKPRKT